MHTHTRVCALEHVDAVCANTPACTSKHMQSHTHICPSVHAWHRHFCTRVRGYTCAHTQRHAYAYAHTRMQMCIYICTHIYAYMHMHPCICRHMITQLHVHSHTGTYKDAPAHTCTCTCVFLCM